MQDRIETKDFQKQWRERFETFADSHDNDAGIAGWSPTGLDARFRHFVKRWKIGTNGSVWLDAGCGAGTYSRFMAEHGAKVIGIDYSVPSLIKAKQRSPDIMGWSAGDVTSLPLKDGYFDGVVCFGVTQALTDSAGAAAELLRIVRPNGTIWVDALNAHCLPHIVERLRMKLKNKPLNMRYEYPSALCATIEKAGGKNVQLHWLPILPQRWQTMQWLVETPIMNWMFQHVPFFGTLFSHAFVVSANRSGT